MAKHNYFIQDKMDNLSEITKKLYENKKEQQQLEKNLKQLKKDLKEEIMNKFPTIEKGKIQVYNTIITVNFGKIVPYKDICDLLKKYNSNEEKIYFHTNYDGEIVMNCGFLPDDIYQSD